MKFPAGAIDREKLDGWLTDAADRKKLCGKLGIKPGAFATRLSRGNIFTSAEVSIVVEHFGPECTAEDILADGAAKNRPAPVAGRRSRKGAGPHILGRTEMNRMYEDFGNEDFVCIFSMDGFLEAEREIFFDYVMWAVKNGLEIFYFFPDSPRARDSINDFDRLAVKLRRSLSDKEFARVHSYFIDAENPYISTRASRFVLIGKRQGGTRSTKQVFLYFHSGDDYWIELDVDENHEFLAELDSAIDPIRYLSLAVWRATWRLPELVRSYYQAGFTPSRKALGGLYSELRSILGTKTSAQRLAKLAHDHFNEGDFKRDTPTVRWLDIGCEDGTNTAVIHRYLKDRDYQVALTAIDTSQQREVCDVLKYSVFLNGGAWSFEEFCKSSPPSEKFDLITCLHSWYLIDPIYLLEAYRKLTHNGVFILSLGPHHAGVDANGRPYRGNFINTLTSVVDGALGSHRSDYIEKNYTEKVIRDDPYRNYAEDMAVALKRFFGEPGDDAGFYIDVHEREVPAAPILNAKGLTDLGKAITIFFTHGILVPIEEEELFSRVHKALRPLVSSDGTLPATEVDFSIHRQQIAMRHRETVRFNVRQRNADQ